MATYDGATHEYRAGEIEPEPELFDALEDVEAFQNRDDQLVMYDREDPTTWICSPVVVDLLEER